MSADEEDAVQAELAALIALQTPALPTAAADAEPAVRLPDVPQSAPVEDEAQPAEPAHEGPAPVRERAEETRVLVPA